MSNSLLYGPCALSHNDVRYNLLGCTHVVWCIQADVQERQAREPPKLGRLRFTPQPTQVLASEDVQGSLRTLRTVPVIAKDRFKSLQKRGLIHVRLCLAPRCLCHYASQLRACPMV